ncbi:ABC transporter permease [bacterium]|nr:ABC transporter permease [bacterium]
MWRNNLKIALRSLLRTRTYSLINLVGLAIGMAILLIVVQYVRHELSFDKQWTNGDRIARVLYRAERPSGEIRWMTAIPDNFSDIALPQIPGIEAASRLTSMDVQIFRPEQVLRGEVTFVEPGYFDMLLPKFVKGNQNTPFPGVDNVVLTESGAKRYFGDVNPIGKLLDMSLFDVRRPMLVTAVIEDIPANSRLECEILAPYSIFYENAWEEKGKRLWSVVSSVLFVMVEEGTTFEQVQDRIPSVKVEFDDNIPWGARFEKYRLQALTDVHVMLNNPGAFPTDTSARALTILIMIGLVILLLACVNFTTLSIGQAVTRLREVGVRKVLGARRVDLTRQFWTETALIAFLALLVAIPLVELILPGFRTLSGAQVKLWSDPVVPLVLAGVWLITVLFAGAYPSVAMSRFTIVSAIKGEEKVGGRGALRRTLVFFQLSVAIGLLTSTFVMVNQMRFVQRRDLGFNGDQVVILDATTDEGLSTQAAELLRNELSGDPDVLAISEADCSFETKWSRMGWGDVEAVKDIHIYYNGVEPQFKDVMQLEMAAGRWFRKGDESDRTGSVVLNETLAGLLGGLDIVGKTFPDMFGEATVIGVVKDFHFHDLTNEIEPLIFAGEWGVVDGFNTLWFEQSQGWVYLRLSGTDIPGTMTRLRNAWETTLPQAEFNYRFLLDEIDEQYRDVARWNRIMSISTGLAILISVLGLIGISAMQVARRTREIGIRKVLGASLPNLLRMLSREVLVLVALANLIAWPVAWWAMNNWLQNFAYRIPLNWQPFAGAGVLVLTVALVTVSLLSIRVASINPVNTLRSE